METPVVPRTDPNVSFEAAAKHLFRHLHEPHALRRNPLVRRLFADATIGGLGIARDRMVLDRIHELVRRAANHCRDSDLAAGKDEQPLRQHAIVTQQCLGRRPIREVAAALGISYRHCYRERADICRRIAGYINEHNDAFAAPDDFPELDQFQLLVSRTLQRAAVSDTITAFRECDALLGFAESAQQKVQALCTKVSVATHFGDFERAEKYNSAARALCAEHSPRTSTSSWNVTRASLDVTEAQLAYCQGQKLRHLRLARGAALRLEPVQWNAPQHVKELYTETLHTVGTGFANLGDLETGHQYYSLAVATMCRSRIMPIVLRSRIILQFWKSSNFLLMGSGSWYPSSERLEGLSSAFELAYSSGAHLEAIDALIAIAQHHAFAGNDEGTLAAARLAFSLVKQQQSERIRAQTSVQLATMLQSTRYSSKAATFLPDTLSHCDVYHRELACYVAAKRALLSSRYEDAWRLAKAAVDARLNKYLVLAVRQRTVAATAAHKLGRARESQAMIESVISDAEKLRSAPVLRDAYRAAAEITQETRFGLLADELTRLIVI